MNDQDEILAHVDRGVGRITLNRPRALNALNLRMIRTLTPLLGAWADDADVREVFIEGAGDRAFCAGGDVRAVAEAGRAGEVGHGLTADFFREEYRLNRLIRRYPKPYVALIDGITMGGGVGLSVHGAVRIATDRTMVAMPETGIGLFPDVGGGYVLARAPGRLGLYLALTGARAKAADAIHAGLATHYLPDDRMEHFRAALGGEPIADLLARLAVATEAPPLARIREAVDRCFAGESVEAILDALDREAGSGSGSADWARETAATVRRMSPTSLKVTHRQLALAAGLDFEANMVMEYRLSQRFMAGHDFYEGIRAVLVDKDHKPQWVPATLAGVDRATVEAYFAPLGDRDLSFE